jgi:hypothetical protein
MYTVQVVRSKLYRKMLTCIATPSSVIRYVGYIVVWMSPSTRAGNKSQCTCNLLAHRRGLEGCTLHQSGDHLRIHQQSIKVCHSTKFPSHLHIVRPVWLP